MVDVTPTAAVENPMVATGGAATRLNITAAAPAAAGAETAGDPPVEVVSDGPNAPPKVTDAVITPGGAGKTGGTAGTDGTAPLTNATPGTAGDAAMLPSPLVIPSPQVGTGAQNVHSSATSPQNGGNPS